MSLGKFPAVADIIKATYDDKAFLRKMASCLILFSLLALSLAYPEGTRHEPVQITTNGVR